MKDADPLFHCFPVDYPQWGMWVCVFDIDKLHPKPWTYMYSVGLQQVFSPMVTLKRNLKMNLGKCFTYPLKNNMTTVCRYKHVKRREDSKQLASVFEIPPSSKSTSTPSIILPPVSVETLPPITASASDLFVSHFHILELPTNDKHLSTTSISTISTTLYSIWAYWVIWSRESELKEAVAKE